MSTWQMLLLAGAYLLVGLFVSAYAHWDDGPEEWIDPETAGSEAGMVVFWPLVVVILALGTADQAVTALVRWVVGTAKQRKTER